jgi:hypothetical protein
MVRPLTGRGEAGAGQASSAGRALKLAPVSAESVRRDDVKNRATNDEWRVYYERADGLRAVVGDPFRRHMQRATARERLFLVGSSLFVLALTTGFYLLTRP